MSNARSPRDVCSTTMGTRGLIGPRFFSLGTGVPAGLRLRLPTGSPRPARSWTHSSALVGRPDLLARGGAARIERLGLFDQEVERGALRQVGPHVVEAPGLLEALAQLLRRGVLARG